MDINHPVYRFLEQEQIRGNLNDLELGSLPYTWSKIQSVLVELDRTLPPAAPQRPMLDRFLNEFNSTNFNSGMHGFWQRSKWQAAANVFKEKQEHAFHDPHLITYRDGDLTAWSDFSEVVRLESDGSSSRFYFQDELSFSGMFRKSISFYSLYRLNRVTEASGFHPTIPQEYKQGSILHHIETGMDMWDDSEASLRLSNSSLSLEITRGPIVWGYGQKNSPILSTNAGSFAYTAFRFNHRSFKFMSFDGGLLAFPGMPPDSVMPEKRLAGHRFELGIGPDIRVAFSELVVYARRGIEFGYLLPVGSFTTHEHRMGDRDNIVIALETWWRIKAGIALRTTMFMDELVWLDLFEPWWGNKFVFQTGIVYAPPGSNLLPTITLESTIARPWVYTHDDTLNSFTSAGNGLGLPLGPNSRQIRIIVDSFISQNLDAALSISKSWKGTGLGSSILDNYATRNPEFDRDTPSLMKPYVTSYKGKFELNYSRNSILAISLLLEAGTKHDYLALVTRLSF